MAQDELTISSILRELAAHYTAIVAEREVFDLVLARRPSRAKDPYAGIREKLRFGASRVGWVRLGNGELMPLHVALTGLRFRIIPTEDEHASGMIVRLQLDPFVPVNVRDLRLEDAQGRAISSQEDSLRVGQGPFGAVSIPALHIDAWFLREGFALGDSVIVTIRATEPLTLRLEREPAAAFRAEAVASQERALVDALVERVARSRATPLLPEDSVLPIYARASWRTAYPGRPWRQLVAAERRLRLVDDIFIADISFRAPLETLFGTDPDQEQSWEEIDNGLLEEITNFLAELRRSRQEAADKGLWDGMAPRISTARVVFDQRDTPETIYAGPVDALCDHSAEIDERAAHGGYDGMEWDDDFDMDDFDDLDFADSLLADDELFDIEDIADVQAFMEQNPALVEATQKLMASLTPDEIAQIQEAETPDDVQRILTHRLNDLLQHEPSLFVTLEPTLPASNGSNGHSNGNGSNGHSGNGHANGAAALEQAAWDDTGTLFADEDWDDQEDEDDDQDDPVLDAELLEREGVLARSSELMERFYQHLLDQGKSETTASNRAGDLWVYAEFLGNYYNRPLDEGDYATLDECLFFFYPRKLLNSSPRAAREMCTSIKQFYTFLRAEGSIAEDAFAQAIWRRRDQAARVVDLYDRLDGDSPQFDRLFAHLFEPYTV
jgi:hypothetical protein